MTDITVYAENSMQLDEANGESLIRMELWNESDAFWVNSSIFEPRRPSRNGDSG